jgi:hypothetical protein
MRASKALACCKQSLMSDSDESSVDQSVSRNSGSEDSACEVSDGNRMG